MAKHTINFAANGALTYISDVIKPRNATEYYATAVISGTIGGGTLTMFISHDGGTTKTALSDSVGTVISETVPATVNIKLGVGSKLADNPKLYATLAGATTPDLDVTIFDNN